MFTFFIAFIFLYDKIRIVRGDIMEGFKRDNVSHGFSRIELFVIFLVVVLAIFVGFPKVKNAIASVKLNGAIDSASSFKESVNNYYVSQLMFDNSFSLDGVYTVSNGNLINADDTYNIRITGNVPSEGYLDYENNVLKDGCIVIDKYAVILKDGEVVSASYGTCDITSEVALGL